MTGRTSNLRSSIYQGADGRWHGWVSMGVKDDGSPDRRHRSGRNKQAVTLKVQELEAQRDAGNAVKPGKPLTVEQWMRTWLDTVAPRKVSASTIASTYRPKVERWIIPGLGKHRLDRLQPEHLDAFYLSLESAGLKPNTVLQVHRILSRALKIAVRRGKVGRNVCQLVDAPSGEVPDVEPLTVAEARAILAASTSVRNGARWAVGLSLGLRQCEALGLRWPDLDLDQGKVRVWWQIKRARYTHGCDDPNECGAERHDETCIKPCARHAQSCPKRTGGGWQFVEPKGKGKATLVLPKQLVALLKAQRVAQEAERERAGDMWDDWALVFATETGRPVDPRADWATWKALLAAAGVRDARVHDARHTAATLLLEQGVDVAVVQEILRHSQITTTRRYTHVTEKVGAGAAKKMGAALWGKENPKNPTLQPELQPETVTPTPDEG